MSPASQWPSALLSAPRRRVAAWPPEIMQRALVAVDRELEGLDLRASRFRCDSEISRLHRADGTVFFISEGLSEAIAAALAAARWTNGLVDPTIGAALVSLGYDRDFAAIDQTGELANEHCLPTGDWRSVRLQGRLLDLPRGVLLDLGATAKGLGSDRSANAAYVAAGRVGGILVSLGGDIAVAGKSPEQGWPILVAEDPASNEEVQSQVVRLAYGALATSSVVCRRWRRGDKELHHIVDPRTGMPATGPWRTVSVADQLRDGQCSVHCTHRRGEEALRWFRPLVAGATRRPRRLRPPLGSWPADSGTTLAIPSVDFLGYHIKRSGTPREYPRQRRRQPALDVARVTGQLDWSLYFSSRR